jgi:hypothetical protein
MMERQQVLARFTEFVQKNLVPPSEPNYWAAEDAYRAVRYQQLLEEARLVYRLLRAGGDSVTILERFQSRKIRTGIEANALTRLIAEVKRG